MTDRLEEIKPNFCAHTLGFRERYGCADFKTLKAEVERLQQEMAWYRSLDLTQDEGVSSIGGTTTIKLHTLWTDNHRLTKKVEQLKEELEDLTLEFKEYTTRTGGSDGRRS